MFETMIRLDEAIFYAINDKLQCSFLDFLLPAATEFRFWAVPIILFLGGLVLRGDKEGRKVAVLLLLAFFMTDQLCSQVLKPLFNRPRPFAELAGVRLLIEASPRYSFPSNHASNIFGAAVIVSYYYRKASIYALAIALLVSFSRIYVGVHYPSDVLGGAVVGTACAFLVIWGEKLLSRKTEFRRQKAENSS